MIVDKEKRAAASYAASRVQDGMRVGLGTGSTAEIVVRLLGEKVREGLQIVGIPSSEQTASLARSYGIPLLTLQDCDQLDIYIDGADEFDPELNLIKGHGGALLREKMVAVAANQFVVVVDESKRVSRLGERVSVPVEVIPFGWTETQRFLLRRLGLRSELRGGDQPFVTDSHNYILHCDVPPDVNVADRSIADAIKLTIGVVEHGLFLGIATEVVVGQDDGTVEVLRRSSAPRV